MEFGLEKEGINNIIGIFSAFPEVDEVILYGSRAKGNYNIGSDIDLAIKGRQLTLSLLNKMSLKLDELYLPFMFDLSIFSQIDNPELIDHINRVGISLYRR